MQSIGTTLEHKNNNVLIGLAALIECMRPAQWIKNAFTFLPLMFSANLGQWTLAIRSLTVFLGFCLTASGVYLWNDSLDWRSDLSHPLKRMRPIPSGRLNPLLAECVGSCFLLSGVAVAFLLGRETGLLVAAYMILNVFYIGWLKHVAILDLMCIALGFVFRVMAGASAVHVEASHWLLMCTFLLALFLGIAKRRQEIVSLGEHSRNHRRVLVEYNLPWLEQASTLVSGSTLVAYALYTVSPETQGRFGTDRLIYTLPFVVYGVLRYLQLLHTGTQASNPTQALLTDRCLLGCVGAWALACALIIYA